MPRGERVRRKQMPGGKRIPVSREPSNLGEPEGHKVYLWRLDNLERAGMPRALAKKLADNEFDLWKAVEMLAAGCSPELLLDIAL